MARDSEDEAWVRAALEKLTGFEHQVFFQSGTAAIEVILRIVTRPGARVALSAFGCWTLPFAVTKQRRRPVFLDIDEYWSASVDTAGPTETSILIDPWGACADGRCAAKTSTVIADMTLAPGARLDGQFVAGWSSAGIISLGSGKPLSVGGGGVALFHDPLLAREARRMYRFGFEDGHWARRLERYTFSPYLFPVLAKKLRHLPSSEAASVSAQRSRSVLRSLGLGTNDLRPGGTWGHENLLPVLLPSSFPLSTRDVEGVAVASGLRLARHPVSPPYLEKAWRRRETARCRRAEDYSRRCLFFYPSEISADVLAEFFGKVLARPERFRAPFLLPRPTGTLPADIERLARHARLVRKLDGNYGLLEEELNLLWPVDEGEAALIQTQQVRRRSAMAREALRDSAFQCQ
ncbi:DegT/DnrJ/EryC1/StrS family aminotransferase [Pendulispora brunnea]|uniref:DegT/DnrJ/EryC1/StrS family aminotransferase n=1 Tax=Pendulispora brunnea TaxID=2905690 RepID=A0ABZ2K7D2_9BACT